MILGILALACGVLGVIPLVSVAGFVFGLLGWLITHDELSKMKKARADPGERRLPQIGLWCSIAGMILSALGTAGWIVYVVLEW